VVALFAAAEAADDAGDRTVRYGSEQRHRDEFEERTGPLNRCAAFPVKSVVERRL
jgi:hypothetical protein